MSDSQLVRTTSLQRRLPALSLVLMAALLAALAHGGKPAVVAANGATAVYLPFFGAEPQVPDEYVALYEELDTSLSMFRASLNGQWDGTPGATIFSAELTPASGNNGERLLGPYYMDAVLDYLDGLQAAGAAGIGMQISYPMLLPDFPRAGEYLAFYQEVADAVHARGMTLLIESSPVFAGTQFSGVPVDYSDLTPATYFAGRRDMLVTIAEQIGPDYLSLVHEPDTEIALTGLDLTIDDFVAFVNDTVATIGPGSGIRLVAGNGSWDGLEYIARFATETAVDALNVHVYPVVSPGLDPLAALVEIAELAAAQGKGVVIGESWPYKASTQELWWPGLGSFFNRDVFSFWSPIDVKFMENLATVAHIHDLEFVSFFWSRYFFAYLDYNAYPPGTWGYTLLRDAEDACYAALQAGELTETGRAMGRLTAP